MLQSGLNPYGRATLSLEFSDVGGVFYKVVMAERSVRSAKKIYCRLQQSNETKCMNALKL